MKMHNATALVDIKGLVRRIGEFSGLELPVPSDTATREAQALSLLQYILDPRSTGTKVSLRELGKLLTILRIQVNDLDMLPWPRNSQPRLKEQGKELELRSQF